MRYAVTLFFLLGAMSGCAMNGGDDPLQNVEEVMATTIFDAPGAVPGTYAPRSRYRVQRGEYLVELLGCGSCHTDGALVGKPDMQRQLAGSDTGLAFTSPLQEANPGVVYPPNITPDSETGIGDLTDVELANSIRAGVARHVNRRMTTMPWPGYANMTDDDVDAIVSYLKSIRPIRHSVPARVEPGQPATEPFVYFGVFRKRN
jgi:mono/diheme cytochrome c family protein